MEIGVKSIKGGKKTMSRYMLTNEKNQRIYNKFLEFNDEAPHYGCIANS